MQKYKAGVITHPGFKMYCKATVLEQNSIGIKTDMQANGAE